jgi:ribonuclease P protein component
MHVDTGFRKNERLSRKNMIKELFNRGSSFYMRPLRVKYRPGDGDVHQVVISVPKRIFKLAVSRNYVKRLIRESYRRHKHILSAIPPYHMAFIYSGDKEVNAELLDTAVKSALVKIISAHGINSES